MSRLCLDTSAYSRFWSGDPQCVELIDGAMWLGVPSIVLGELWIGFLLGKHLERNQAEFCEFMANPAVEEIPVDREVSGFMPTSSSHCGAREPQCPAMTF